MASRIGERGMWGCTYVKQFSSVSTSFSVILPQSLTSLEKALDLVALATCFLYSSVAFVVLSWVYTSSCTVSISSTTFVPLNVLAGL